MLNSTRGWLLAALTATSFLAACRKDEAPSADPAPYCELANRIVRPDGSAYVITNDPPSIRSAAVLGTGALKLELVSSTTVLHIDIDAAQLKHRDSALRGGELVGTYAWKSFDRPNDPAVVHYQFRWDGVTSVFPFSETTPQLTGNLTITAYDAKRHLISGRYELGAPNQLNPLPGSVAMFPLVTIRVYGKFDNVKVAI
ncbi:hypothetical protein [Hymenobacter armeniacus]|uniref:Uncharacterized protein n=1 Tax=Hymenobacter armeniacus TaxID=2771358 RepID=A0ABR8K0J2_9BACT|nr:hypothetical protein [Hymenobacter armeniacus]MBD2723669.1 hypothetical protein [Hymenobacter armeniacus]